MESASNDITNNSYRACRAALGKSAWERSSPLWAEAIAARSLSSLLDRQNDKNIPAYLPDLARLEEAHCSVTANGASVPLSVDRLSVNPSLQLVELSWKGLSAFLDPGKKPSAIHPIQTNERVLLWYDLRTGSVTSRPATDEDLLVLKMAVEGISVDSAAAQGSLSPAIIDEAIRRAAGSGLVLMPPSRIRRDPVVFHQGNGIPDEFFTSPSFTLQWHITQTCDLHCKHCYDRSDRSQVTLDDALRILDDLGAFCGSRNVSGAVSFTGGNPLLHPDFTEIYRAAAERGFPVAILGNPAPRQRIEELVAIQMPSFFQVSLEGLREHNDSIRGQGHFDRIMAFLDILKELQVSSMVMLTLTSGNVDQVLLLAEALRERADTFHFNRLSMVGEGARLHLPDPGKYESFLRSYLDAARSNPIMGIKDNLINILHHDQELPLFGGCTGYGCGAAFNFVSLLADGEVHACRKFPSAIGNIQRQSLSEIYDSQKAKQYRLGSAACRSCAIRPVCGGCLASAHSHGKDIFQEKDPFCFVGDKSS